MRHPAFLMALGFFSYCANVFADSAFLTPTNRLLIPSVTVGDKAYSVGLELLDGSNPLQFQLVNPPYGEVLSNNPSADFSANQLILNQVLVGEDLYQAELQLVDDNPLSFSLQTADLICQSCAQENAVDARPSVLSNSFPNQGPIPVQYSCEGENLAPGLTWMPGPEGTVSYTIIMDDPDALSVAGFTWVHMNLFNLPANILTLPEGITGDSLPTGASFGLNHDDTHNYIGPCPPPGLGSHRYVWVVYALNTTLAVPTEPMDRATFETTYSDAILSSSRPLQGVFMR